MNDTMKTRYEYVVSVAHRQGPNEEVMCYTVRRISRKQAICNAILRYPNAKYIHVMGD